MKFSWKLINYFIKLNENGLINLEKQLTLSGIETESIENFQEDNDKVIDLSITSNRKDISSTLHLAIEITTIVQKNLKIDPIKLQYKKKHCNQINNHIHYTRVHPLDIKFKITTPNWLLKELEKLDIRKEDTITNIQNYIRSKWGKTFEIINPNKDSRIKNIKQKIYYHNSEKLIFLTFSTKHELSNNTPRIYNSEIFYENLYLDSMQLISTITKITIGKYYEFYTGFESNNIKINVKKSRIDQLLGNTNEEKCKFIKINEVTTILEQLQLHSKYNRKNKYFSINVPSHRTNDLKREIDIIEEIGRIYRFQNFFNTIKTQQGIQNSCREYTKLNHIRNALRNLGLNEVINCCLTTNQQDELETIKIHNPINKEQPDLRFNIVDNLIKNHINNLKYAENNIEIFEIGKIFQKNYLNKKQTYLEKQHLGGLIYNSKYTRDSWSEKSSSITFFHVKAIIEMFLEKIHANTKLSYITDLANLDSLKGVNYTIKNSHRLGIYDNGSNNLIGILGELKTNYAHTSEKKQINIFIFEIDITKLIESIQKKKHLKYQYKTYSKYPSVIRDISVRVQPSTNIETIKTTILNNSKSFIESVEIFNEYTNENEERFVGIRTTYRAQDKTLSTQEIKSLEKNLQEITNRLQN
uniref:phenylalanine--tRNA ligase n=1 Tax=Polysiphonia scopulorum TaxID=257860 RepID=A0A1Z1MIW1_9FLOR|nr:Phenylalanine-tRNA ligase beta subunit [Polysiphonia scopulorum]ARW65684.1 Phenylalanine-tRNA ligase beta subunit [Polysiphonia scopulorum]